MLKTVQKARSNSYIYFLTGDESWFYLQSVHDLIWLQRDEEPPVKEKKMIDSPKMMLTVFWNPEGFLISNVLPPHQKFNSEYFINQILQPIYEKLSSKAEYFRKTITLHFDNSKVHTSGKVQEYMNSHNMKRAVEPPYLPDIAPSEFFLFGYLKEILKGSKFETPEELKNAINVILISIPPDLLNSVFLKWEVKLQMVIDANGNYLEE